MLSSPQSSSATGQMNREQSKTASRDSGDQPSKQDDRIGNVGTGVDAALAEPFPPFARQEVLENPFEDESRRDMEFQERKNNITTTNNNVSTTWKLHQQILELILEFHAWSTSRPDHESSVTGHALFEEARSIQKVEEEQGMWNFSFGMRACILAASNKTCCIYGFS
ncbi:uncharacterized protein FOMMEDRAFT_160864 [Fomitiporia mediterranea MF3/22]|uniref:uncharacterized protein n=1 Tax=Fomitiporia mediterranea (strain MF3/22) TaxID=694068 RepID=UPI00044087D7|nr:uncharacterized protein FOMMEDRAFT_160864 [Fomitiporia mediterranea MF3/22]EJC99261.1 hypothetical protein FOMMEDRAFT_160864 [Fomitiporia mediterranea MF3/22]